MKKLARAQRRGFSWLLVTLQTALLCLLVLAAPAMAAERELTEAEQLELAKKLWNSTTQAWLYLSEQLMAPCFRNDERRCQDNMREALKTPAPPGIDVARAQLRERPARLVLDVRNGQFRYETAFSLRALVSIVGEGDCPTWRQKARGFNHDPGADPLRSLLMASERELGPRTKIPEFKELNIVRSKLQPCIASSGTP